MKKKLIAVMLICALFASSECFAGVEHQGVKKVGEVALTGVGIALAVPLVAVGLVAVLPAAIIIACAVDH